VLKTVAVVNKTSPAGEIRVKLGEGYFSRLRGLMFYKEISPDGGIIMDEKVPSRMNASIHMLCMNFKIAVIWLDQDLVVVDKVLAKPWALAYVPKKAARYVVELHPSRLDDFSDGDQVELVGEGS